LLNWVATYDCVRLQLGGQVLRTLHVKSRGTTAETRIGPTAAAVARAATVGKLVAALKTDCRPVVMVWWRGLLATVIAAENSQFAHIERPALRFRLLEGILHELLLELGKAVLGAIPYGIAPLHGICTGPPQLKA